MAEPADRLLTMGRIGGPFGVQGWIKVHTYTAHPENLIACSPWWVRLEGGWVSMKVTARVHGKGLVARFEGHGDREAVRALVGAEIAVERSRLDEPAEGQYYWADLVGATVVNLEGSELGRVSHLIETGANDVLVISGERERLIPFVPERYIIEVDLVGKRIVADWKQDY